MKKIKVSKIYALVNDEDYQIVNQFKWFLAKRGKTFYAECNMRKKGKRIYMHRLILNAKKGELCDHINHNGLDNRRENLRKVDKSINTINWKGMRKDNLSGFRGVWWNKDIQKWQTQIQYYKKRYHLGSFINKYYAALMYDFWATYLFGQYANTNFKVVAHSANLFPPSF